MEDLCFYAEALSGFYRKIKKRQKFAVYFTKTADRIISKKSRGIKQKTAAKKEEIDMADLSVLDLQNLRHLIGGYTTCHCKLQDYASQAQDPEVKKLFQDAANSAMKNKQDLMKFL